MTKRHLRMRHIRTFAEVARQKSITRAAEQLNTAQPNVSRTLREMEEIIGHPLFDRTGRSMILTGVGQTVLSHMLSGLDQIDYSLDLIAGTAQEKLLSVLLTPSVSRSIAPGAVLRFKQALPGVTLRLETTATGGMVDRVREGAIDFMVGRLGKPDRMEGLNFEHLYSEPLIFVARPDHPLADPALHDLPDLKDFPVVLPEPGPIIREELDRFALGHGIRRFDNVIETMSLEFINPYLSRSDAIAFCPYGAVRQELTQDTLREIRVRDMALTGSVGVSARAGVRLSSAAQVMIGALRDEARENGLT